MRPIRCIWNVDDRLSHNSGLSNSGRCQRMSEQPSLRPTSRPTDRCCIEEPNVIHVNSRSSYARECKRRRVCMRRDSVSATRSADQQHALSLSHLSQSCGCADRGVADRCGRTVLHRAWDACGVSLFSSGRADVLFSLRDAIDLCPCRPPIRNRCHNV